MVHLHQNEQIILYNNVGSYHFYLGNKQMIKCAPNLDLSSYKLYDKKGYD